jgi:hypothetical protein
VTTNYQFESAEEVEDALRGEYGPELQQEAEAQLAAAEEAETLAATDAFVGEIERLEKHVGRELTGAEIRAIHNDAPELSANPDFVEAYGPSLAQRGGSSHSRREMMAEAAQEAMDEGADDAEEPSFLKDRVAVSGDFSE